MWGYECEEYNSGNQSSYADKSCVGLLEGWAEAGQTKADEKLPSGTWGTRLGVLTN